MIKFNELKPDTVLITKDPERKRDMSKALIRILSVDNNGVWYRFVDHPDQNTRPKGSSNSKKKYLSRDEFNEMQARGIHATQKPCGFYMTPTEYRQAVSDYKKEQTSKPPKPKTETPKPQMIDLDVYTCPRCDSPRLTEYHLREDNFIGDSYNVNDTQFYEERDQHKPELNVLYCHNCQHFFDSTNDTKQKTVTIKKETNSL